MWKGAKQRLGIAALKMRRQQAVTMALIVGRRQAPAVVGRHPPSGRPLTAMKMTIAADGMILLIAIDEDVLVHCHHAVLLRQ
jgi:hypothetical protein